MMLFLISIYCLVAVNLSTAVNNEGDSLAANTTVPSVLQEDKMTASSFNEDLLGQEINAEKTENKTWNSHNESIGAVQPHPTSAVLSGMDIVRINTKQRVLYKFGMGLLQYAFPTVLFVGLVGNTLSLLIMVQKHNRRVSCCVLMATLACSDNIVCLNVITYWIKTEIVSYKIYDWQCKVLLYIGQLTTFYGMLLIIAMTVERCIVVRFPLKAASLCTVRRARITAVLLAVLASIYTLPYGIYTRSIRDDENCAPLGIETKFSRMYSVVNIVMSSAVPFLILLVLNLFIISTLRNRQKEFGTEGNKNGGINTSHSKNKSQERQLTIMLIVVSLALLIFTLPQYIRFTLYIFVDLRHNPYLFGEYIFANGFTNTWYFINNSINFLLYCISGKKFRQDLVQMFKPRGEVSLPGASASLSSLSKVTDLDNNAHV